MGCFVDFPSVRSFRVVVLGSIGGSAVVLAVSNGGEFSFYTFRPSVLVRG